MKIEEARLGFLLNGHAAGGLIMGANVAERSFLEQMALHGRFRSLQVFAPPGERVLPDALMTSTRVLQRPTDQLPGAVLEGLDGVYTPYVFSSRVAYLRERYAPGPFSIAGFVHSLAHVDLLTLVARNLRFRSHELDVALCPSTAVQLALRGLMDAVDDGTPEYSRVRPRLVVRPLGVDIQRFCPADKLAARAALDIDPQARICLYVGRLMPWNKMDLAPLVIAFARAMRARWEPRARLLIVGQEQLSGYAELLAVVARDQGVIGQVELRPDVPTELLPLVYAAADFFISPTDNVQETFGLTPLEAMASGLPVLLSDWNGYSELIEHGREGLLVPVCQALPREDLIDAALFIGYDAALAHLSQTTAVDVDALADGINQLLHDASLRARMSAAARQRAESYAWPRVVASCEEHLMEAASRGGVHRREAPVYRVPYRTLFSHYPSATLDTTRLLQLDEAPLHAAVLDLYARKAGLDSELLQKVRTCFDSNGALSPSQVIQRVGQPEEAQRALHFLLKQGILRAVR